MHVIFYWLSYVAENEQDQFLRNAMLVLQDHVGGDWFTFGLHLDVDVNVLNRLNSSYQTRMDYRISTRDLLTAWVHKFARKATWDKIVEALKKIGNNALAQQVEEQYIHLPKIPDGTRRGYTFNVSDFQN